MSVQVEQIIAAIGSTIQNARSTVQYRSKIVRLEANGGFTDLYFSGPNFSAEHLSTAAKQLIDVLIEAGHPDISQSIIQACIDISLTSILETGCDFNETLILTKIHQTAQQLKEILDGRPVSYLLKVRVIPEIEGIDGFSGWKLETRNRFLFSLKAHRSGVSADEFLHRLFQSTTFVRPLEFNPSEEDLVVITEAFRLSLGLALKKSIHVDEIEVVAVPWQYYPGSAYRSSKMWGSWDLNHHSARSVSFFSNPSSQPPATEIQKKLERWFQILRETPAAHYTLGLIMSGIWLSLEASNFDGLVRRNKCLQGMHFILTGLEGLTLKDEVVAGPTWLDRILNKRRRPVSPTTRFKKGWKQILSGTSFSRRQKNEIVDSLYGLRNSLAHGDFDSINICLPAVKKALGDNFNPGSYDFMSVGFQLNAFCQLIFDHLSTRPEIIWDFYSRQDTNREGLGPFAQ